MPNGTPSSLAAGNYLPEAIRIPQELEVAAAGKLVGDAGKGRASAGRRMVSAAALHGIDLSLMWGTVERRGSRVIRVRQVCLAVPGAGKTAMLVISPPGGRREAQFDHFERIASINAAIEGMAEMNRQGKADIRLAQALPDPKETWAVRALTDSGALSVGELAYLRAPLRRKPEQAPISEWPAGIDVQPVGNIESGEPGRRALVDALNRSYIDTLDCPELCGLRETEDILESHRATGIFSPKLWWLITLDNQPHGCMLLSHIPDHSCIELVYLGLSPELRGKGLGRKLMDMALSQIRHVPADHLACAVDMRNTPARTLYERVGFREFGRRMALVKPIGGHQKQPAAQ